MLKNGVYHIGRNTIVVNDHTSNEVREKLIEKYPQLNDNSPKKRNKNRKSRAESGQSNSSESDND